MILSLIILLPKGRLFRSEDRCSELYTSSQSGKYDFVFFANEPYYIPVINQLNYITAYDNLNDIVYSERYSLSEQLIPMIQEVNYQYVA